MALATNKVSQDPIFMGQGAKPTEKSENERVAKVVKSENTNIAHVTENTENKRAATVTP